MREDVSLPPSFCQDPAAWQELARATLAFYNQAPWEWMPEVHVFGVRLPQGQVGYVSVSGHRGDIPGLTVYLGPEGWQAFWAAVEFLAASAEIPAELAWETPALQLAFLPPDDLTPVDRELVQRLGLSAEVAVWPVWRSLRPGFVPWYLDSSEVVLLSKAVEATVEVAAWLRGQEPDLLLRRLAEGKLLTWVGKGEAPGPVIWMPLPKEVEVPYRSPVDAGLAEAVRRLPQRKEELEVDCTALPVGVQDPGQERPRVPYLLLAVTREGEVLTAEALTAEQHVRDVYEQLVSRLLRAFVEAGYRPGRVYVRRPLIEALLTSAADVVGFEVVRESSLRAVDALRVQILRRVQSPPDVR